MGTTEKTFLICNCENTMKLNAKTLGKALGVKAPTVHSNLCRSQLAEFQKVAGKGAPMVVACTQEAPLFLETIDEIKEAPEIRFVNIRERAGWSKEGTKAAPKMAALLAEAVLDLKPATAVTLESDGTLLVIGTDETAIEAAKQVAGRLDVTVLLTGKGAADAVPPAVMDVPVFIGTVKEATGHLGAFQITVEGFAAARPSSRGSFEFDGGADGVTMASLILDLGGGTPLFTAPGKRDGYFNPDPGNPALVQRALLELVDMVGTFEKPRYVDYQADLCAYSRSEIVGCTRCLDVCPTGAITPDGDHVAIDAQVCAGCGSCVSVCPTGAAMYNLPADNGVFKRLSALLGTYQKAGGADAVLLVYDTDFGGPMIDAMARLGGGLPATVLPFMVNQVTQAGLDFLLSAVAYGAGRVALLVPPAKEDEAVGLKDQAGLATAVLDGLGYDAGRLEVVVEADPEKLEARLYGLKAPAAIPAADFLPMGRKRTIMDLALGHLHAHAPKPVDSVDLPAGAPFGAIRLDTAGCTLCLACVGACPTAALKDNPDKPQLGFLEEACVQCGLCKATCPENVITLEPRLVFSQERGRVQVLKEEEPFACIRCNKPFGTRAAIERMTKKLENHPMFAGEGGLDLIRMCDDCRIIVQAEIEDNPLAGPPRPLTRTTEDYLRERDELREVAAKDIAARAAGKKPDKE